MNLCLRQSYYILVMILLLSLTACGKSEEEQAQNEIQMDLANIERGLAALRGYQEPYKSAMLEKFRETYDLAAAINVFTQIRRREETEAALRQRDEERKAREAAEAEQRKQEQSAAQAARTAQELSNSTQNEIARAAQENAAQTSGAADAGRNGQIRVIDFRIWVTPDQIAALREFLFSNGIRYGKVPKEG